MSDYEHVVRSGMTLRDWFAGQALAGWIAGPCGGDVLEDYSSNDPDFAQHQRLVAGTCYGYARAMLAERAKQENQP